MVKRLVNSLSPKNLALLTFLTLGYFAAAKLAIGVIFVPPYVTPIWFPSGIALAAFILFGYRIWPAILMGSFLDHVTTTGFIITSFTIPATAALEGLAGAYLVKQFAHGAKAFDTAKGVFLFVLFACLCAPSISATLGTGVYFSAGGSLDVRGAD